MPFSNDIKRNAFALLIKEYPDLTIIQGNTIIKKCAIKCRDHIHIFTGKKTSTHSSRRKLYDSKKKLKDNKKNNPIYNAKRQRKVAEENHLELMQMFTNGQISEKPLNEKEVEEIVDG